MRASKRSQERAQEPNRTQLEGEAQARMVVTPRF